MEELRFPRNAREGLLYGGLIAAITGYVMMTFNMVKSSGYVDADMIADTVIALPLLWVAIMLIMSLFVGRVSDAVVRRVLSPSDSANVRIVANIVVCVSLMSVIMTAVGPAVGSIPGGFLNLSGFEDWLSNWPVNFCVAFWVEMLLAQPLARTVMKRMHIRQTRTSGGAADGASRPSRSRGRGTPSAASPRAVG